MRAVTTAPEEYFEAAVVAFERATTAVASMEMIIQAGPGLIRLLFAGSALIPILLPALEHLRCDASAINEAVSLTILIFDTESTGVPMPPPAWDLDSYGKSGEISGFNTRRIHTLYQPGSDVFQMYDRGRGQAVYWVKRPAIIPYWETSFAMRTILHWWTIDKPYQLIHSGAVGFSDGGVLIAGPSGSGKTTSTLACLDSSLLYIGDDYLMVGLPLEIQPQQPVAYSLYNTAKLLPDSLERLPKLVSEISNPDKLETEKAMLFLHRSQPKKIARQFPIKAILTPHVTRERDTHLTLSSAMACVRSLLPTTLLHLPGGAEQVKQKIVALVRQTPNYILEAGTDLTQIPQVITKLLNDGVRR